MMRRAFTMIELLTVMAIMGLLGIAASAGYSSMQRGIRERSAVAGASALLKAAKERAAVDRVPTAVFCYNKLIRDANASRDDNAVVVGVMTAVRRYGRISYIRSNYLYDEFNDLDLTYEALSDDGDCSTDGETHSEADLAKRTGMRLWKFPTSDTMEYSIVADAVWCTEMPETVFSLGAAGGETNVVMSAFYNLKRSRHEPSWKVGDAYAFEIGEIQLPNGFIFGDKVPNQVGAIELVDVMRFDPESAEDKTVEVWSTKPGSGGSPQKFKSAGRATSDENRTM